MFANFFKKKQKNRFVTEELFAKNIERQLAMNKLTAQRLIELGINEGNPLVLDVSFYTIDPENLKQLEKVLQERNYTELRISSSAHNNTDLYILSGKTTPIEFNEKNLNEWVKEIVAIAYKYDCEFDGWGTSAS